MSLLDKLKKNSTIVDTSILSKSKLFKEKELIETYIPMMNVAFSANLNGGFGPGLTMFAGPSKHFKTAFSLLMAKSYMQKYPDSILLFYDSEFGTPIKYFETFDIEMDRVLHSPVTDIEQLKFDMMNQIKEISRGEKLIIILDSIGNLASKKEVEDALEGKSVADMSRAKQIKSLFRMVTPHLTLKNIPMVVVNHTYKTMELYSKDVVGGGTGSYYSADNIYIIGRQQEKEGTEIIGYNFIINVEKSRYVKEKSKIPITVSFDGGINKWSGLLDIALESGHVVKPSNGWYAKVDKDTGEILDKKRFSDTQNEEFWKSILDDNSFKEFIRKKYEIGYGSIMESNAILEEEKID